MDDRSQQQNAGVNGTRRRRPARPESMQLVERDGAVVRWIYDVHLATRQHVQEGFFSEGGRSRCQRRLTLLYRNRYLDKLPDQPVNAPDIYYLSRRATNGLRLLRTQSPEEPIRPYRVRSGLVQHTLDLASCRLALERACAAVGYTLSGWLTPRELNKRMSESGILPDGYLKIARPTLDGSRTAAFFVEVERSGKSALFLEEKIARYRDFYYGGGYERVFGTKALRVLVLIGSDYGLTPQRQITRYVSVCDRLGVTIFRFAPLATFLAEEPGYLLHTPIWQQPGEVQRRALF